MTSFAFRARKIFRAQLPAYSVIGIAVCITAFSLYKSKPVPVAAPAAQQVMPAPLAVNRLKDEDLTRPVLYMNGESTDADMQQLRSAVNDVINKHIATGAVRNASVYIRKMDKEESISINDNEFYDPGSMMKVTIMIAHLKEAMNNNSYLSEKLLFKGRNPSMLTERGAVQRLVPGKSYTRKELIESMIVYSDNDAVFLLVYDLTPAKINKIYNDLNIPDRKVGNSAIVLSPSEYSRFFTVLYNASYINRKDSDWALQLLCKSVYNKSITRALPAQLVVAHKYGVAEFKDITYLGESGLFYSTSGPYLLVVFTKGNSEDKQSDLISEISTVVFQSLGAGRS
jgi:beta-lactamase class A